MRIGTSTSILATLLLTVVGSTAFSAAAPHPECPWVNPRNTWKDYITGRVPSGGKKIFYFSVRFEEMGSIRDSKRYTGMRDPLGKLWAGACYTVSFSKNRWWVSGYNEARRESELMEATSNGAHPEDYFISLGGRVFQYNEAGEVFDTEYGHVGNFRCVLDRSICKKYAE